MTSFKRMQATTSGGYSVLDRQQGSSWTLIDPTYGWLYSLLHSNTERRITGYCVCLANTTLHYLRR